MSDYFEDTLANEGFPEAWLDCDSNDLIRIKNKWVKRELNIEKLSQIKSKTVNQI